MFKKELIEKITKLKDLILGSEKPNEDEKPMEIEKVVEDLVKSVEILMEKMVKIEEMVGIELSKFKEEKIELSKEIENLKLDNTSVFTKLKSETKEKTLLEKKREFYFGK